MVDSIDCEGERNRRIAVGGPDILSLRNISVLAAGAAGVRRPRSAAAAAAAANGDAVSKGSLVQTG